MRKLYAAVLILLLTISCAAQAESNAFVEAGQFINEDITIMDAAISGDTLYLLDNDSRLFAWDGQAEKAALLMEKTDASRLIGGDELLLWQRDGSRVGRMSTQGIEWLGGIDLTKLDQSKPSIKRILCADDALYFLYGSESDFRVPKKIARFDAQGVSIFPISGIQEMIAFGEGKLLVTLQDTFSADNSVSFAALSSQTGEALATLSAPPALTAHAGGLAYDPVNGHALVCDSGRVLSYSDVSGWEAVNYVPQILMESIIFSGWLKGRYLYLQDNALILRDTSRSLTVDKTPLVVKGYGFDPYMIPSFMRDHPDIPLVIDNDFSINRTQFISSIQNGDSAVDIYVLPDSWNVWSLIDKGYALDLSPFPALYERIQAMDLQVQQAIAHEGKICALPIAMYVSGWTVRPDLLAAAGYDRMPATITEFFHMLKEWDEEKDGNFDFTYSSHGYEGYRLRLYPYVEMAVTEYITQYEQLDQALSFDTPAFRQTLAAIEALDYPPENVDEAIAAVIDDNQLFQSSEAIFNIHDNNPLNAGQIGEYAKVLIPPLPYEENGAKRATALIYLAMINPYSQHVEDAVAFLTYVAEYSATDATMTLYPNQNDPIPDQGVLQNLHEAQQELEKQKSLLAGADDEHQGAVKGIIAQLEAFIEDQQSRQYLISADAIQAYRALQPCLYIPRDSFYWRSTTETKVEIESIMKRYAAGVIDGEGMIRELNQKFELLFLEQ